MVNMLKKKGFKVASFTGATPSSTREAVLKDLEQGLIDIVCCTAALEMGWHVPGLRTLIFTSVPSSITQLIQLLGRLARGTSDCGEVHILYHQHSLRTLANWHKDKVKAHANYHLTLNDYTCMYMLMHTPGCRWQNSFQHSDHVLLEPCGTRCDNCVKNRPPTDAGFVLGLFLPALALCDKSDGICLGHCLDLIQGVRPKDHYERYGQELCNALFEVGIASQHACGSKGSKDQWRAVIMKGMDWELVKAIPNIDSVTMNLKLGEVEFNDKDSYILHLEKALPQAPQNLSEHAADALEDAYPLPMTTADVKRLFRGTLLTVDEVHAAQIDHFAWTPRETLRLKIEACVVMPSNPEVCNVSIVVNSRGRLEQAAGTCGLVAEDGSAAGGYRCQHCYAVAMSLALEQCEKKVPGQRRTVLEGPSTRAQRLQAKPKLLQLLEKREYVKLDKPIDCPKCDTLYVAEDVYDLPYGTDRKGPNHMFGIFLSFV